MIEKIKSPSKNKTSSAKVDLQKPNLDIDKSHQSLKSVRKNQKITLIFKKWVVKTTSIVKKGGRYLEKVILILKSLVSIIKKLHLDLKKVPPQPSKAPIKALIFI